MPDYRRNFVPGGTYFFTCVTHSDGPRNAHPNRISFVMRVGHEAAIHLGATN